MLLGLLSGTGDLEVLLELCLFTCFVVEEVTRFIQKISNTPESFRVGSLIEVPECFAVELRI